VSSEIEKLKRLNQLAFERVVNADEPKPEDIAILKETRWRILQHNLQQKKKEENPEVLVKSLTEEQLKDFLTKARQTNDIWLMLVISEELKERRKE